MTGVASLRKYPWQIAWGAGLAALLVLAFSDLAGGRVDPMVAQGLMCSLCVGVAAGAIARARRVPGDLTRTIAGGVGLWAAGDVLFTLTAVGDPAPFPGPGDVLFLAAYVAFFAAVLRATRARVADWDPGQWLDGLMAALVVAGVGQALLLPLLAEPGRDVLPAAGTLAYVLGDLLLVGVIAAGCVVTRGRLAGPWPLLLAGVGVLAVADLVFLLRVAAGTYAVGGPADALWPVGLALLAAAARREGDAGLRPVMLRGRRLPIVPLVCSTAAVAVLVADHFAAVSLATVVAATLALLLATARTALTLRHNLHLHDTAVRATTDDLTGLGNRRALVRDLDAVLEEGVDGTLALFDLDGFKAYNDAYGHLAGDALLAALARELGRAVADQGRAYRLGGDEFCTLVTAAHVQHELVVERALAALRQEGGGFAVSCSHGVVRIPDEAPTASAALGLADTRMYAQKDARRSSTRRQSRDLLLQILHEQQPDLEEHSGDVGGLVAAVGRRLGMGDEELDHARHAAELHDVGKVAIPPAILDKPGPLDDDEWALMRRHTVIGERILAAVPALVPVGRMVRSSHERWDGGGYPDGLAGEAIPLAARIIAVCDSFHAITTDRPYRRGRSAAEAVAELRRCAGTQFDAAAVEAFAAVLADGDVACPGARGTAAPTPAALAVAGRSVEPARAVASAAAGELATLTALRGLLRVSTLARCTADVDAVLDEVSRTIASSLGFRTVVVNLLRPAWDDLLVTTVTGGDDVRDALLGTAQPVASWQPLLHERFARGPAYFVPDGAYDFGTDDASHVPDLPVVDDPRAWHPGDALFVPLLSSAGELLGVLSLDEPVWGARPTDDELEVLGAVAAHAAVALEHAREAAAAAARRRAEDRVAALGAGLLGAATPAEALEAAASCVREALGFGTVLAVSGPPGELDGLEDRHGTVLLGGLDARVARARLGLAVSVRSGRGPLAWSDHLLAVPLTRTGDGASATLWLDDPADRLLPGEDALRLLGVVAAQTAIALRGARGAAALAG